MNTPRRVDLSAIERELQSQFPAVNRQFTSNVREAEESEYVKKLAVPLEARGKLPMTREKFVVNENPARVQWEREVRLFLSKLNKDFGHRITAPMIYEWVTNISIKDLVEAEGKQDATYRGGGNNGSANMHLRHINFILKEYFGKPYKTKIAGRDVGRAYTVRPSFRVRDRRPVMLTLWPEWQNGTLEA